MNKNINDYQLDEHLHRYACWTAARAASISRFSNEQITSLINGISLQEKVTVLAEDEDLSAGSFQAWFIEVCTTLNKQMENSHNDLISVEKKGSFRNTSFGIAAKIISIYIKTYHIIPHKGQSKLSNIAYPPIDSILLRNARTNSIDISKTTWSKFEKHDYLEAVDHLVAHANGQPLWKLEYYWDIK